MKAPMLEELPATEVLEMQLKTVTTFKDENIFKDENGNCEGDPQLTIKLSESEDGKGRHPEETLSSPGNCWIGGGGGVVKEMCRVCGDFASGVHFGVFSCEGCKVRTPQFYQRNHYILSFAVSSEIFFNESNE